MAAVFNKLFLIVVFSTIFSACFSGDASSDIADSAFDISLKNFEIAEQELESVINRCNKNRKSVSSFFLSNDLKMDIEEIKIALFLLNNRAEVICENGAREKLFFVAAIHRQTAKHYGKNAGSASEYSEDLMFSYQWNKLEFESKYLLIDKYVRSKLEAIDELKIPFSIFKTIDEINESMGSK